MPEAAAAQLQAISTPAGRHPAPAASLFPPSEEPKRGAAAEGEAGRQATGPSSFRTPLRLTNTLSYPPGQPSSLAPALTCFPPPGPCRRSPPGAPRGRTAPGQRAPRTRRFPYAPSNSRRGERYYSAPRSRTRTHTHPHPRARPPPARPPPLLPSPPLALPRQRGGALGKPPAAIGLEGRCPRSWPRLAAVAQQMAD